MPRLSLFCALAALLLALPASASALTVTKAELKGGDLRLEGTGAAPGIFVTVESTASSAGGRADTNGNFKVAATGFRAPDCKVTVSDRQTPIATPTLSGCTVTTTPPPTTDPAPTGTCVINPGDPATVNAGDLSTYFFTTTGCSTPNSPVKWSLVAGRIPPGMTGPFLQGVSSGGLTGRPNTEGTYTFTLRVTDQTGASDTESFTITVVAPRPLTILNASTLAAGTVGQVYDVRLTADGGVPGYLWQLRSGSLPGGVRLSNNAIAGTPTTRGTFSFTIRVTDSRNTTFEKAFSITVG